MRRNITFGDVLGSSRPDTHEKAAERWCFLKSEYNRKQDIRAWKDGARDVLAVVAMLIGMVAIGVAALYIEL